MAKNNPPVDNNAINIIGTGTSITGDIKSDGDIRIDGSLNGNLTTKGKIVIGPKGKISGEIHCKNSDVSGTIEGKIKVEELLSLKSTAKILGDIITNKLAIEPSAVFTGTCDMGGNTSIPNVQPEQQKPKSEKQN